MNANLPPQGLLDQPARFLLPAVGGYRHDTARGLVEVRGLDAVDFLQRVCSQDVAALEPGAAAPTAFLSNKGKLVATAVAIRIEDGILLDTAASHLALLGELCERYHFSEKLRITRREGIAVVERVGGGDDLPTSPWHAVLGHDELRLVLSRGGLTRERVFAPATRAATQFAELPSLESWRAECVRIGSGEIEVGRDTDERTLVLEAGLDDHVSTAKGCYVGQEIVARIHTYGHLNRRLVRLALATTAPVADGTELFDVELGEAVGRVTSACAVHGTEWSLALGYLPDAFLASPSPLALGMSGGPAVHHADLLPA
ncbi:MAG: hypothetical protein U1F36_05165 [Planctomycetota bacterium]